MKIAVIPGSFDPVTSGHVRIVERASALFDRVYVTAMVNSEKTYMFSPEQRLEMLSEAVAHIHNAVPDRWEGMLWQYALEKGACAIVKGVRNAADLEYEMKMADFNLEKNPNAQTIFLTAEPEYVGVSSTAVRNCIKNNQSIEKMLPQSISAVINIKKES